MDENKNEELNQKDIFESTNENQPKGKKSKVSPIITTVLIFILILAIAIAGIFFMTKPKNNFIRLVNHSMSYVSKGANSFEKSVIGRILAVEPDTKMNLDAKATGSIKTEDVGVKEWSKNLNDFEFNVNQNIDFSNDYTDSTSKLKINGEDFVSGTLVKNKDIASVKLDNITNGYISADESKLPELWEKLKVKGPISFDNTLDVLRELDFSEKDIKNIKDALNKFGMGFFKAFVDDDFSYGIGTVDYDEGTMECKSMDFFVDTKKFNDGVILGLENIIANEKYVDSIHKLLSSFDKANGFKPFSREEFGNNLNEMLKQLNEIGNNEEFAKAGTMFIMRIYYQGNKIVRFEMRSPDYNSVIFELTCVNNKDSGYYKYSDGMTVYEDRITKIDKVTKHLVNVNYINQETGEIEEGYGSEVNIDIDNSNKNIQNIKYIEKARIVTKDMDFENLDITKIEPTVVKDYTLKCSIDGEISSIEFNKIEGDPSYTNTFNLNAKINKKAEFEYAVINEGNNFDATSKTVEELTAKKDEILKKWNENFGDKQEKVEQMKFISNIYLGMFMPKI